MGCCQHYLPRDGGDEAFTVAMPKVTFGRGALSEVGERAKGLGVTRVALFTDKTLRALEIFQTVTTSLDAQGLDYGVFDDCTIEPDGACVAAGSEFLREGGFDGMLSLGGGSVMDTGKTAAMCAAEDAQALDFVAKPFGGGRQLTTPLMPHLACPTTAGTGSEVTPLSVIYFEDLGTKIPILSRQIMPSEAVVDPTCTYSLPDRVVAASAFDLLSHALEAYTARPFCQHNQAASPTARLPIQGANPWSDIFCREALDLAGRYLVRSVQSAEDQEARDAMSWAASLAGIGFGNTGTHAPHAMGYPVSALNKDFSLGDYPESGAMVPHGFAVIVNSPALFRFTAEASPERHLAAAARLGAETRDAAPEDAGEVVAGRLIELMRAADMPNGIGGLGYTADDVEDLAALCKCQRRALQNAPRDIDLDGPDLAEIYSGALNYW